MPRYISLRNFNHALSAVVIAISLYLIVTPWTPELQLWLDRRGETIPDYSVNLSAEPNDDPSPAPAENRIVIPSIALNSEVFSGNTAATLTKGPWFRPNTSAPSSRSNTVISGHRFAYGSDGKWIFYHLDKVKIGDRIGIYWDQIEYIYEVDKIEIVPATATYIEAPSNESKLTLYTCTPLWTAKDRLVVTAKIISIGGEDEEA